MDRLTWLTRFLILLAIAILVIGGFLMAWNPCPLGGDGMGWC